MYPCFSGQRSYGSEHSYDLCNYGLYSYGLYSCDLYTYGQRSYGSEHNASISEMTGHQRSSVRTNIVTIGIHILRAHRHGRRPGVHGTELLLCYIIIGAHRHGQRPGVHGTDLLFPTDMGPLYYVPQAFLTRYMRIDMRIDMCTDILTDM